MLNWRNWVRVYTVFSFFVFKFAKEKRITNSFFVFRFQICERKTNSFFVFRFQKLSKKNEKRIRFSFFVFKSEVRKTKNEIVFRFSFFVFAFRMVRSHCHFGWPVKIGSFGGILRSHWQRFEEKKNSQKLHRRNGTSMYLQMNIGRFGAVFYVSTI